MGPVIVRQATSARSRFFRNQRRIRRLSQCGQRRADINGSGSGHPANGFGAQNIYRADFRLFGVRRGIFPPLDEGIVIHGNGKQNIHRGRDAEEAVGNFARQYLETKPFFQNNHRPAKYRLPILLRPLSGINASYGVFRNGDNFFLTRAWAGKEGYVTGNPPRQIDAYAVKKAVKYVPPAADIKSLLTVAKPGFEHDFLTCLLHTAARISEIRVLAWEDVDLGRRIVTLWTSKRRGGNMEARKIAMSTTLHEVLSRLWAARFRDERYVFNDPNTGTAYTRTSNRIKYLMRDLCLRAGVTHFGAHSLRHFLATGFHDPYKAQKVLGHQNLKTTEIYLHDLGVDREAAAVFEDITNRITNEKNLSPEVVVHKGKNDPENDHVINSTNGITNEITSGANSTNEKRGYFLQ